jgi:hypothetical protein
MPFCPNCRTEYRPGFTTCADCQVNLVELLPSATPEEIEKANLYRLDDLAILADFDNLSEAKMFQELLAGNQIESTLWGQEDRYALGSIQPVSLLVEKHNLNPAREIYEAYFAGKGIPDTESTEECKE